MLTISQVAKQLKLNPQTLYFYERIGLIPPPARSPSGYRLFSESDLERLYFIAQAKTLGLTLEEIKELLALQERDNLYCDEMYQRLQQKIEQIEAQIEQLQTLKAGLTPLLEHCRINAKRKGKNEPCVILKTTYPPSS